jgi:hypothetical protein
MKNCFFLIMSLLAGPVYAGWTPSVKINEIIAEGNEEASSFLVVLSSSMGSDSEGATCEGTYHYLNASTEKGKMMFSMLLSAKVTGSSVRFVLSQAGSSQRCQIYGVRY